MGPQLSMQKALGAIAHCQNRLNVGFMTMEVYRRGGRPGGGGLGTLSRDILQGAADANLPLVGVSIAHSKIQTQKFDSELWQHDEFVPVNLEDSTRVKWQKPVKVFLEGQKIPLSLYIELFEGASGGVVPLLLLNSKDCERRGFNEITDRVYPGSENPWPTLAQEIILGMAGIRALDQLQIPFKRVHLNDGHPAFAAVQLLLRSGATPENLTESDVEFLRSKLAYTSHTLVKAAADTFTGGQLDQLIKHSDGRKLVGMLGAQPVDGKLKGPDDWAVVNNAVAMTELAMFAAGRICGVSKLNAELIIKNIPQHAPRVIGAVTNAVHPDWAAPSIAELFNQYAPGWKTSPDQLGKLADLKENQEFRKKLWGAHMEAKLALKSFIEQSRDSVASSGLDPDIFARDLDPNVLTVGFARRVAPYKRHDLLFYIMDELLKTISKDRPIQFVFAGKAHPNDDKWNGGKEMLQKVLTAGKLLNEKHSDRFKFIFLPNYDPDEARMIIPGVDVWLNNPIWGEEASGTSTMDAILNAVLLLTVNDGCIPEMVSRGEFGWTFGLAGKKQEDNNYEFDAASLYDRLKTISEIYYSFMKAGMFASGGPNMWTDKMIDAVSKVLPYFLTPRLIREYSEMMWDLA